MSSGRKSKYISLPVEEEIKRDIRRTRNRQAAEKCKRKRLEIEDKLNINVKLLKEKQDFLNNEVIILKQQKEQLEILLQNHNCNVSFNNFREQQQQQQQNSGYYHQNSQQFSTSQPQPAFSNQYNNVF